MTNLLKDLIRDLVGIIFPGSLMLLFLWASISAILMPFNLNDKWNKLFASNSFSLLFILLVIAYILGQMVRIRKMGEIDKKCQQQYWVEHFWKKEGWMKVKTIIISGKKIKWRQFGKFKLPIITNTQELIEASGKKIDYLIDSGYGSSAGTFNRKIQEIKDEEKRLLKEEGTTINIPISFIALDGGERFPYYYESKIRRFKGQSSEFNDFYEPYDVEGVLKTSTFFNFCKSYIYEKSASFKEELLREEALARLISGIHNILAWGRNLVWMVLIFHIGIILMKLGKNHSEEFSFFLFKLFKAESTNFLKPLENWSYYTSFWWIIGCLASFWVINSLRRYFLKYLQGRRIKEVNLGYEGFFFLNQNSDLPGKSSTT